MNLLDQIYLQNPWYRDSQFIPPELDMPKRDLFFPLMKEVLDIKQITGLVGLRRVGKSTLMKQIVGRLLKDKIPPANIIYFSFDQPIVNEKEKTLEDLILLFLGNIVKKDIHHLDQKLYIFLDEIQLIPYWQDILKRFYDINNKLKFFISGSSSLFLLEKSKESLAGRIFISYLPPLSFSEYKKLSRNDDFSLYLDFGQFPELIEIQSNNNKKSYLKEGVIEKVLEVDIARIYGIRKTFEFERLFWSLLPNTGQIIQSRRLMSDLSMKKATLFKYLNILEKSLLINKVLNLSGSFRSEKRLLRKLYPASTNFLSLISDSVNICFKIETYICSLLTGKFKNLYLFHLRGKEVDFIIPDKELAIEVKYQEHIHSEDYEYLLKYAKQKQYRGIILTKNNYNPKVKNLKFVSMSDFENYIKSV